MLKIIGDKYLKIELGMYGTLVFGKILEQHDSLRNVRDVCVKGEYSIGYEFKPAITKNKLCLRNMYSVDDNIQFHHNFSCVYIAEEWIKNISTLIIKTNKQLENSEPKKCVVTYSYYKREEVFRMGGYRDEYKKMNCEIEMYLGGKTLDDKREITSIIENKLKLKSILIGDIHIIDTEEDLDDKEGVN